MDFQVSVLDMISLSVIFTTDSEASSNFPVISVLLKTFTDVHDLSRSPKNVEQVGEEYLFTLTQDAKVNIVDCKPGSSISSRSLHLKEHTAISMYVLGKSLVIYKRYWLIVTFLCLSSVI